MNAKSSASKAPKKQEKEKTKPKPSKNHEENVKPKSKAKPQEPTILEPQQQSQPQFKITDNKLISINLKQLADCLTAIAQDSRFTPLILDQTERSDTFFQYSDLDCLLVDCKALMLKTLVHKSMSSEDCLQELRTCLVNGLHYGKVVCFQLSNSAFDFNRWNHAEAFPLNDVFTGNGKMLLQEDRYSAIVTDSDLKRLNVPMFVANNNFKVLITSRFSVEDYKEFLEKSIPMDLFIPIEIKKDN